MNSINILADSERKSAAEDKIRYCMKAKLIAENQQRQASISSCPFQEHSIPSLPERVSIRQVSTPMEALRRPSNRQTQCINYS
jgi:hypothetical protein